MKTLLWLDDCRDPSQDDWLIFSPIGRMNLNVIWVTKVQEFKDWINLNGLPDGICFDHDLGEELTGYDAAKWLCEYTENHELTLPPYSIQSANPVGRENIHKYLENFKKYYDKSE